MAMSDDQQRDREEERRRRGDGREDGWPIQMGVAELLADGYEKRRRAWLQYRSRTGCRSTAAGESRTDATEGKSLADRRRLEFPLRRRNVRADEGFRRSTRRPLRQIHRHRRLLLEGTGAGLRDDQGDVRSLPPQQIQHRDRRDPV